MWLNSLLTVFLITHISYGKDIYKVGIYQENDCSKWIDVSDFFKYPNEYTEIEFKCFDEPTGDTYYDKLTSAFKMINGSGIAALIGPFNEAFAHGCESARIPFIVTSMVPYDWSESSFLIRIVANIDIYGGAIDDMLLYLKWKKVGFLYDNPQVPHVLSRLVDRDTTDIKAYDIRTNSSSETIKYVLKDLRDKYFEYFILMCSSKNAALVLTQALYLNLLSRPNAWLVVNLDADEVALQQYEDSRANLTSLLIVMEKNSPYCALQSDSLVDAVFHDAMTVLKTLIELNKNSSRVQMRKNLRKIQIEGCTGRLEFTKVGRRREIFFQMNTLSTVQNGTIVTFCGKQSGTWRSGGNTLEGRITPSKSYQTMMKMSNDVFGGNTLIVTTLIEPPFIQWKNKTPISNFSGDVNGLLEGFCIDILDEIKTLLNFKYNISLVPDGKFGGKKTYGWTGMVRVLHDKRADIALAPFQITPSRSEAVDFTKPFMTKGTSVVVRKPERSVSPFQFLFPLSKLVWICIFASNILTALTLFVTSRINCDRQNKKMDNLRESFWYIWGTLLRGNLQISPRGISSRVISCVWWFFSLIVISIYTANLAAFLTISNAHIPIDSASDLAYQSVYEYGTVDDSQIENFFKQTTIPHYSKMWAQMYSSGMVRRVEHGFEEVMKKKYAFLWDSPVVRHETASNCDLMELGNPFDLKGYGIATQKNSPFTESVSLAILKLNDEGILYRLEGKWWRRPNCPDPRQSAKSREIEIQVASGMFIVLLSGIGLAGLVFVLEILYIKCFHKRRKGNEEREREENNVMVNSQNHVSSAVDAKEEEIRCKLARTLSIGENSIQSKWESYDQL